MKPLNSFSIRNRTAQLEDVQSQNFDLIVIGGGITGAGIALDAASRGLKTVLFEKGDFASGTSSKSTKLIHGGLRYLKQFDFWLVKEVGSERAIVHKLAPHLVIPEKMLLPLVEGGSYGKWLTSFGLKVYDLLAQVSDDDKRQMLNIQEALKKEPLLPEEGLNGAGYYAEYRTDDARLTIEILKTGLKYGVRAFNYISAKNFTYNDLGKITGVVLEDKIEGDVFEAKAKYVINAAGPWVDDLRIKDGSRKGKRLHLTKGVHLVFPHDKLPVRQSVYFDVPDGRMIFAIPRGRVTYVGTTDTDFEGDLNSVGTDLADAVYLIAAINHMFPDIHLELDDIISSWAGLRPLIHEEGKSASELSRKDEIFESESGLISIAGGKLTGYRKMAERAVNKVVQKLEEEGRKLKTCHTDGIKLIGNDFSDYSGVKQYIDEVANRLTSCGLQDRATELVTTYGKQTDSILNAFEEIKNSDPLWQLICAELEFGIAHEMITCPQDFWVRRTGKLYFDMETVRKYYAPLNEHLSAILGVGPEKLKTWNDNLEAIILEHSNFDPERLYS